MGVPPPPVQAIPSGWAMPTPPPASLRAVHIRTSPLIPPGAPRAGDGACQAATAHDHRTSPRCALDPDAHGKVWEEVPCGKPRGGVGRVCVGGGG